MKTCIGLGLVLGLGLTASACDFMNDGIDDSDRSGDEETASQIYQGIVNGSVDNGDLAIVALYTKFKNEDGGGLCTGTIISPTVVLTAAHCVDPAAMEGHEVEFVAVVAEPDLTDGVDPGSVKAVKETHFHPEWSLADVQNGFDIAVAILDKPTTIQPKAYRKSALTNQNMTIRMVGYGLDDGVNQTGAGVKRQAISELNSFDDMFLKHGQFNIGPRICNGDSGGPILAVSAGRERVIGVNSFGLIYCLGEASSTNVTSFDDWIDQWVEETP